MLAIKPGEVVNELFRDNSYSYADCLIMAGARKVPEDVFTCAQQVPFANKKQVHAEKVWSLP